MWRTTHLENFVEEVGEGEKIKEQLVNVRHNQKCWMRFGANHIVLEDVFAKTWILGRHSIDPELHFVFLRNNFDNIRQSI